LHNLFTHFFDKKMLKSYLRQLMTQIIAMVAAGAAVCFLCAQLHMSPVVRLVCCTLISIAVPNVLFLVLFYKTRQFRLGVQFADTLTKGKLDLEKRIFRKS